MVLVLVPFENYSLFLAGPSHSWGVCAAGLVGGVLEVLERLDARGLPAGLDFTVPWSAAMPRLPCCWRMSRLLVGSVRARARGRTSANRGRRVVKLTRGAPDTLTLFRVVTAVTSSRCHVTRASVSRRDTVTRP